MTTVSIYPMQDVLKQWPFHIIDDVIMMQFGTALCIGAHDKKIYSLDFLIDQYQFPKCRITSWLQGYNPELYGRIIFV